MSKAQKARDEKAQAIEYLRESVKEGDTIYTNIESVSRSGMSRTLRVFRIDASDKTYPIRDITYSVAKALGSRMRDNDGGRRVIVMGGCGYDVGHSVVYELAWTLFGKEKTDALTQRWL